MMIPCAIIVVSQRVSLRSRDAGTIPLNGLYMQGVLSLQQLVSGCAFDHRHR